MTVFTALLIYLLGGIATGIAILVIGFLIALAQEELGGIFVVVSSWVAGAAFQIWGLLTLVFWVYAMFQGFNPIEAFDYRMW